MAISIATNMASMRASNDLSRVDIDSNSRRERLASGRAVNAGRDGGAELSVSEGMRAEIGGLTQGARNTEQALDLLRTAEGGRSFRDLFVVVLLVHPSASGLAMQFFRCGADMPEIRRHCRLSQSGMRVSGSPGSSVISPDATRAASMAGKSYGEYHPVWSRSAMA